MAVQELMATQHDQMPRRSALLPVLWTIGAGSVRQPAAAAAAQDDGIVASRGARSLCFFAVCLFLPSAVCGLPLNTNNFYRDYFTTC